MWAYEYVLFFVSIGRCDHSVSDMWQITVILFHVNSQSRLSSGPSTCFRSSVCRGGSRAPEASRARAAQDDLGMAFEDEQDSLEQMKETL